MEGTLGRHAGRADRHNQAQYQRGETDQRQAALREIGGDALERRLDVRAAHARSAASRTRGSSSEYMRSTTRLMTTNRQTMISTYATMNGRSSTLIESIS